MRFHRVVCHWVALPMMGLVLGFAEPLPMFPSRVGPGGLPSVLAAVVCVAPPCHCNSFCSCRVMGYWHASRPICIPTDYLCWSLDANRFCVVGFFGEDPSNADFGFGGRHSADDLCILILVLLTRGGRCPPPLLIGCEGIWRDLAHCFLLDCIWCSQCLQSASSDIVVL
ncbi:hypothetical protein Nepgr_033888 [Nepenthes gracilis]|uniref:Secreted protein n=1 Tax=Nepenthes gracilis TaxID=150966 RepID=A0AAD3TMT6_NEPGR|nr:hypothetical protein Nepgr_033888 [Nepenthes gracilis]